jgi:hypothetical protein
MSLKVIDGTFYQGKAEGGINSSVVDVSGTDWECQESLNDKGKVYYRLWILWNDIDTRDFFTAIRKEFLSAPFPAPKVSITNPF